MLNPNKRTKTKPKPNQHPALETAHGVQLWWSTQQSTEQFLSPRQSSLLRWREGELEEVDRSAFKSVLY